MIARLLLAALLLATDNAKAAEQTSTFAESAEKGIAALEARIGGRLGVAALDTGTGRRTEHRAQERFPMCSTFKALAAATVLHRVDKKQDRLDQFVPYTEADLLEYAPVTKEHVKEGGMKLGDLCAAAIGLSDNTAGNLLLKVIGGPDALTRYARSLGDELTQLDRVEPYLNTAVPGDKRDTTTPAAMLADLRAALLGDALSSASRTQLEAWLVANQTGGEMIRAGLPKEWRIGDKTGRGGNGATNDIAIIRPPSRAPLLLTVYLVESTASSKVRQETLAELARIVTGTP